MEVGVLSLGDVLPDPISGGAAPTDAQRTRAIVEMGVAAEGLGFDLVHIGEHHGSGYQLSAPPVVLAAIGARTSTIRLSTGVTLAANLDPVRMAEDYATLDGLTNGRAEIVAGRGSYFARTFEYLGQDAKQSKALFAEHVELLVRLLHEEDVCHPGGLRAPLDHFTSRPRPEGPVPVWVGGGTSRDTPALAVRLGLPPSLRHTVRHGSRPATPVRPGSVPSPIAMSGPPASTPGRLSSRTTASTGVGCRTWCRRTRRTRPGWRSISRPCSSVRRCAAARPR